MSGGVDSSVVAALLKRQGYDVVGVTLQLYDHGEATGRKGSCCAGQDIEDARRVAQALSIPHYVLDYEKRFKTAVIESFAESYIAGETPIPCVTCNQKIKFHDLTDTAAELGAEFLATGHYIQKRINGGHIELYRAADSERDQSYFLFSLTREQLAKLEFPLGAHKKDEVRALAREFALPVAEKPDSQDICFVPRGRYSDVIERLKPGAMKAGAIVHVDGRTLGRHEGIINYTVGQRRGLGIPGPEPLFVLRLDAERNEVVVGPRDCLRTEGVVLRNVNWLGDDPLEIALTASCKGRQLFARVRSTQRPQPATLVTGPDGSVCVMLQEGEEGIATGQACVFYADGTPEARILGGGWIAKTIQSAAVSRHTAAAS
jgi:tRNA-specific 2-thiouridylase